MALKHQKLYFLSIHAAIFYFLIRETRSDFCRNALKDVNDCWNWHKNVEFSPCSWGNLTVFGRCATIGLDSLKGCDEELIKKGKHRSRLYTTLMDIICQNDIIYKEFDTNKHCWNVARACAYSVVKLPMKTTDLICQNVTAIINDCKSQHHDKYRSTSCLVVTEMFLDELLKKSEMCGAACIFGHFALILISFYTLIML